MIEKNKIEEEKSSDDEDDLMDKEHLQVHKVT